MRGKSLLIVGFLIEAKRRIGGEGAIREELHRRSEVQRRQPVYPLAGNIQGLATRSKDGDAWTARDDLCDDGGNLGDEVLAVVQEEQQLAFREMVDEIVDRRRRANAVRRAWRESVPAMRPPLPLPMSRRTKRHRARR